MSDIRFHLVMVGPGLAKAKPRNHGDDEPLITDERGDWCLHENFILRSHERRVLCRKCKAELDPISVLSTICQRRDRVMGDYRNAVSLRDQAHEELKTLRREAQNLKARIKTAKRKTAAT